MKITIRNISPIDRGIPTPVNTSIPIKANSSITFEYPKGYYKFFKKLENYDFKVDAEDADEPISESVKITDATPEVNTATENATETDPKVVDDTSEEVPESVESNDSSRFSDEIQEKLNTLSTDQLKKILSKLNIVSNARRTDSLIYKINESGVEESDLEKLIEDVTNA
jgi:hypothetical protein